MNDTERNYTGAARLVAGLSAIRHLVDGGSADVKIAYEDLVDAVSEDEAIHRERNLCENNWAYGEGEPSPLIHPDYTDPGKSRKLIVGVISAEEADIEIETIGPFPMGVEYDAEIITINSEDELFEHFHQRYGGQVTTVSPMPFAVPARDC